MDEKEIDALEVGVRKGVRARILGQLADATRSVVIRKQKKISCHTLGIKLSRVLRCPRENTRLMEVNLKDDAAMEDFYLSSLRIWTAK